MADFAPYLLVHVDRAALGAKLGEPTARDVEPWDGLEVVADLWHIVLPCGLAIEVLHGKSRSEPGAVACAQILGADDAAHVLHHLGLESAKFDAGGAWAPPRFRVVRQDDNGHRFTVHETTNERAAQCLVAMYEARGHKQLYEVEPSA